MTDFNHDLSREAITSIRDTCAVLGDEVTALVTHLTAILADEGTTRADVLAEELAIEQEAHRVTIANRDQLQATLDALGQGAGGDTPAQGDPDAMRAWLRSITGAMSDAVDELNEAKAGPVDEPI